jgi:hypothetical protein
MVQGGHFSGKTGAAQADDDHARKFHQRAVAGGLDDTATVLRNLRINKLTAMRFEAFERPFLVRPISRE